MPCDSLKTALKVLVVRMSQTSQMALAPRWSAFSSDGFGSTFGVRSQTSQREGGRERGPSWGQGLGSSSVLLLATKILGS